MAISNTRVSVTTTATLIATNAASGSAEDTSTLSFLFKNATGTEDIYLGAGGISTATGFQWSVDDGAFACDLEPGESIYGRVASATQVVHVIVGGR